MSKEFEICKDCPITDGDECVKAFGSEACQKILISNIVEKELVDNIDKIGSILEESSKDYERLCKSEMKIFGVLTYESYKEFMVDSIRSGKYPELQLEGFK